MKNISTDDIDALLPQTQCRECGYDACKPYAEAIMAGEAQIDLCAPGGIETLQQLALITEQDPTPYIKQVEKRYRPKTLAVIREDECIGCVKCIKACPVDAIIGSAKHMHTVIADQCTGCELCIEPCPMDCIDLIANSETALLDQADSSRQRYQRHMKRISSIERNKSTSYKQAKNHASEQNNATDSHKAYIQAAIARVKAKKKP